MEVMCLRTVATASGGAIWQHLTREKVDDSTGKTHSSYMYLSEQNFLGQEVDTSLCVS